MAEVSEPQSPHYFPWGTAIKIVSGKNDQRPRLHENDLNLLDSSDTDGLDVSGKIVAGRMRTRLWPPLFSPPHWSSHVGPCCFPRGLLLAPVSATGAAAREDFN